MIETERNIPLHLHPMGFIESFLHHGARIGDLFYGTGLSPCATEQRHLKISYRQQCQIVKNGLHACAVPGLGLRVGQAMEWNYSGSVGGIVGCSPNLVEALAALRRYLLIAQPYCEALRGGPYLYNDKNDSLVCLVDGWTHSSTEPEVARFELEFCISLLARLYNACGSKPHAGGGIRLGLHGGEPSYSELYRELPGVTVHFSCKRSYIAAPKGYVTDIWRPLRGHAFERVSRYCEGEFEAARLESTCAERVYWYLSTHFHPALTVEEVASKLTLSSRGLTRRLALENTSFRQLFHRVKMEALDLHLRNSSLSSEDIAAVIGFSCATSMHRAVRNWRGGCSKSANVA